MTIGTVATRDIDAPAVVSTAQSATSGVADIGGITLAPAPITVPLAGRVDAPRL
jgi:hypothetical protein